MTEKIFDRAKNTSSIAERRCIAQNGGLARLLATGLSCIFFNHAKNTSSIMERVYSSEGRALPLGRGGEFESHYTFSQFF